MVQDIVRTMSKLPVSLLGQSENMFNWKTTDSFGGSRARKHIGQSKELARVRFCASQPKQESCRVGPTLVLEPSSLNSTTTKSSNMDEPTARCWTWSRIPDARRTAQYKLLSWMPLTNEPMRMSSTLSIPLLWTCCGTPWICNYHNCPSQWP
jgi:hypothetical protein